MPYMKQLEEELKTQDVERLQKQMKESKDFRNSLQYLSSLLISSHWPLFGFKHFSYNSSYPFPYSNFLNLNSTSFSMYVPYSSCDNISICVQRGFIIDTEIDNPHYFGETSFNLFESHAYLLICSCILRQTQKKHPSKKKQSDYWLSDWKKKEVHQMARCNKTTGGHIIQIETSIFITLFQLGISSLSNICS